MDHPPVRDGNGGIIYLGTKLITKGRITRRASKTIHFISERRNTLPSARRRPVLGTLYAGMEVLSS